MRVAGGHIESRRTPHVSTVVVFVRCRQSSGMVVSAVGGKVGPWISAIETLMREIVMRAIERWARSLTPRPIVGKVLSHKGVTLRWVP